MSMQADRRRRSRLSLLSLLLLIVLVVAWLLLRCTNEREGRLGLITTAQVQIGVSGASPTPLPSDFTPFPGATRTPVTAAVVTPTPRTQTGVGGIRAEVLGATDVAATATAAAGAPPGQQAAQATSTAAAGATATAAPGVTSTPAPGVTPQPTIEFGPLPTATPAPGGGGGGGGGGGSSRSLAIDGFVAPGAYTNASIRVTNNGPVTFNYSFSMFTDGDADFAQALRLRVYLRVGASCDFPGAPPSGDDFLPLTGDQAGTVLYDGNFATGNKFGDPSVEIAPGDRQLASGESEVLCFELFFPWGAGNVYQGKHVNGTLVFTAKSPES